jgi:adenosylhomocysteinase
MDLGLSLQVSTLAAITRGAAAFAGLRGVLEELDRELASALVGLWISSPRST